jgi:hypothetical protein
MDANDTASLTLVGVSQMLSMTPAHVRQLVTSGAIRAVNMARDVGPGKRARWRISPAAVAAFQKARSNISQPPDSSPDLVAPLSITPKGAEEFV